jgi:uncharacterized membrane protein (DUF485 family)
MSELQQLARARARIATILTLAMILLYFGFVTLIAYNKPLMGKLLTRGLSLGILLGVLVIVGSWILTYVYVRWANNHYDTAVGRIER